MNLIRFGRIAMLAAATSLSCHAATGRIIKTLPHLLDSKGRNTVHPSLFARDAYQVELKAHPERCAGMRFDVQWKAHALKNPEVTVKLELRGANSTGLETTTLTALDKPGFFNKWTGLAIRGDDFKKLGSVRAWRITLWDGSEQIAEQKSFLW